MNNKEKIKKCIIKLIKYIGEDPNREGLKKTPERIVKSYEKLFGGYNISAKETLSRTFTNKGCDEMIILKDIELYSTCEHHMLPFFGKCHIAYIPRKKIVGISKIAKLVEIFSRRLQIQERMTMEIGKALEKHLKPKGVAVICEAKHMCMLSRGVEKQNSVMVTSYMGGSFKKNPKTRNEFLNLIKK